MRFITDIKELSDPEPLVGLADGARITWTQSHSVQFVIGDHARVRLELLGTGETMVDCRSQSTVIVLTRNRATAQITATDFAQIKVKSYGESQPQITADGHARVLVLAYDRSRPHLQATDFSIPMVVVHDQAQPRCADWPADWHARTSEVYIGQRLTCFATEEAATTAARRVFEEWRVCRNRYVACLRVAGAIPKSCPNVVDVRWQHGTIHLELPGPGNPRAWYSPDAHHVEPLTEANRAKCTRYYLEEPAP